VRAIKQSLSSSVRRALWASYIILLNILCGHQAVARASLSTRQRPAPRTNCSIMQNSYSSKTEACGGTPPTLCWCELSNFAKELTNICAHGGSQIGDATDLSQDTLTDADWVNVERLIKILRPFI
jgi:hypothetical protein